MMRGLCRSPLSFLLLAAITAACLAESPSPGGEEPRPDGALHIRRVYVPADHPERWPADWRPMPLAEFERRLEQTGSSPPRPPAASLDRAYYTATLAGDALVGGKFDWTCRRQGGHATALDLAPLNLAVSHLAWTDGPAVWGTTPSGAPALIVDRPRGSIAGEWNLLGKRLAQTLSFDVRVARATVSQLLVRLPEDRVLQSSIGDVLPPRPAEEPGWWLWPVDLGSQNACKLTVAPRARLAPPRPLLLVRHDAAYALRPEAVRIQTDFFIEALEAPVQELRFTLDAAIEIIDIHYGDSLSLAWKTIDSDAGRQLALQLPDPLIGQGVPLRIQGIARARPGALWTLPQVRMINGVLLEGQLTLRVQPPLELTDSRLNGYHQISLRVHPAEGETRVFRQSTESATAAFFVGNPRFEAVARVLTRVHSSGDPWTAVSQIEWKSRYGSAFSASCRVPPDWEVTDVRAEGDASELTSWDVVAAGSAGRQLKFQFADALAPDHSRRVRVTARRAAAALNQSMPIPVWLPEGVKEATVTLLLGSDSTAKPVLESQTGFELINAADLPAEAASSEFFREQFTPGEARGLWLRARAAAVAEGTFSVQAARDLIDVEVTADVVVGREVLAESYVLQGIPQTGPLKRLLVYLTEPGPPLAWQLDAETAHDLSAYKLPVAAHSAWNLPPTGDLWEIRFPVEQAGEFKVRGARQREIRDAGRIALAFVPHANLFRGEIAARAEAGVTARFQPRLLERAPSQLRSGLRQTAANRPTGWVYQQLGGELGVRIVRPGEAVVPLVAMSLSVSARLQLADGATDMYAADYRLQPFTGRELFQWHLPDRALVIETRLDGRRISPENENSTQRVLLPDDAFGHRVEIDYCVPTAALWGPNQRRLALPQTTTPVLGFQLSFEVPENVRLADEPDGIRLNAPLPRTGWREALFGPLTRAADEKVFNPFVQADWTNLWDRVAAPMKVAPVAHDGGESPPDAPRPPKPLRDAFAPAESPPFDARVLHASRLEPPSEIVVELWDAAQARLLVWCGVFLFAGTGVALRAASAPHKGLLALGSMAACSAGVASLPQLYAQAAGGCLVGVILAALLPERFVFRPKVIAAWRPSSVVPPGSTRSFQIVTGLMLAVIGLGGVQFAAPSAIGVAADADNLPQSTNVLIPIGPDGQPAGRSPLVYLPTALFNRLNALQPQVDALPASLIASADYAAVIDSEGHCVIDARYLVHVLSPGESVRIEFPLTNVNLGGADACRIDGHAHPALPGAGGKGIAVLLNGPPDANLADEARPAAPHRPAPASYRVEFRLHPIIETEGGTSRVEVATPRMIAGRVEVFSNRKWGMLELRPQSGDAANPAASQIAAWLGHAGQFSLRWSQQVAPPAELSAELQATASCLADIFPGGVQYRYQVDYRVDQGQVESLTWKLPPGMAVRSLQATDLLGHPLEVLPDGGRRLQIEFSRPQTADFRISATLTTPVRAIPGALTLPVVDLTGDDVPRRKTVVVLNQIGIRQPPDFRLSVAAANSEQLKPRSVEEFSKLQNYEGARPTMAWQWDGAHSIVLNLIPLPADLKISSHTTCRLGIERLDLTWDADIESNAQPVFEYRLRCDPRLHLRSISILEEDAERLLRWSQTGDQLVVFLTDKTARRQKARIQATLPWQGPGDLTIPEIRLLQATQVENRLSLYHDAGLRVDFRNALPPAARGIDEPALAADARELFAGRFELTASSDPLRVQVARNTPELTIDEIVMVQPGDSRWKIETSLLFHVRRGVGTEFEIEIPPAMADSFDLRTDPPARRMTRPGAGGRVYITLSPEIPVTDKFLATVSENVAVPAQATYDVPQVRARVGAVQSAWLLAPRDATRITPLNIETAATSEPFPERLHADFPSFADRSIWSCLRGDKNAWQVTIRPAKAGETTTDVALAETRLQLGELSDVAGQSWFWITTSGADRFELDWPAEAVPPALIIDGQLHPTPRAVDGVYRIPLLTRGAAHLVVQLWAMAAAHESRFIHRWPLEIPRPRGLAGRREVLAVFPASGFGLHPTRDNSANERLELFCDRWESAIELLQSRAPFRAALDSAIPANAIRRLLYESENAAEAAASAQNNPSPLQTTRLADLKAQTAALSDTITSRLARRRTGPDRTGQESDPVAALPPALPNDAVLFAGDLPPRFALWIVDNAVWKGTVTIVAALIVLALGGAVQHWKFSTFVQQREWLSWAAAGVFWWAMLTPSWLGLVFVVWAAANFVWFAWHRAARERALPAEPFNVVS